MGFWGDFFNGFDPTKWQTSQGGFGQAGHDLGKTFGFEGGTVAGPDQTAFNLDTSQSDQDRQAQLALIQQLQQQANGQGPSLVQSQLQQATDANIRQAMAMGQSMQGGMNAGASMRNIMDAQAGAQQQAAGQSAFLKNLEMLQARQQLAAMLGQTRGTDVNQALMRMQGQMGLQQMQQQAQQYNSQLQQQQVSRFWSLLGGGMNGAANASTVFGNNSPVGGGGGGGGGSMFSNLFGGSAAAGGTSYGEGTMGMEDLLATAA